MSHDNTILADRYKMLIENEKNNLLALFNENEWKLMQAVCTDMCYDNEYSPTTDLKDFILKRVQEALDLEFEQMKVSRTQIEGKLQSLTVLQQFALVEELENFWIQINKETEEARKSN